MSEKEQPATLGKSDFADLIGVAYSTISSMLKKGRVVTEGNGRNGEVKVVESLRLIAEHTSVSARIRRSAIAVLRGYERGEMSSANIEKEIERRLEESVCVASEAQSAAMARKISAQADQEEMKAAQMAGNLIAREDVDAAMRFLGAAVRAAMDVFPDQTAPIVCAVADLNETHALLNDACRNVLADIGAAIERQCSGIGITSKNHIQAPYKKSSFVGVVEQQNNIQEKTTKETVPRYEKYPPPQDVLFIYPDDSDKTETDIRKPEYKGEIVKGSRKMGPVHEGRTGSHLTNPFFEE